MDDLVKSLDTRFGLIHDDLANIRGEIRDLRTEVSGEIGGLRIEMREEIGGLRAEIGALNGRMITTLQSFCVALIGVIAALVAVALY